MKRLGGRMSRLIDPVVTSGEIRGQCPKCTGSFQGFFNTESEKVDLKCVDCGHVGRYFYLWPDELPRPFLRHRGNRWLLETSFKGPKRQRKQKAKKNKNPDNVLKGQLAFDIPKNHGIIQ